jgi:hypothetical protein
MSKVIFTIEAANAREMFEVLETFNTSFLNVIEEHSLVNETKPTPAPPPPAPTPEPPKRSHKGNSGAAKPPAPAPAPEPVAPPAPAAPKPPAPERELPQLDALKQIITNAVRAAQKGEGPKEILALLPGFKKKTGLDFVMNAADEHREALAQLLVEAGVELEAVV